MSVSASIFFFFFFLSFSACGSGLTDTHHSYSPPNRGPTMIHRVVTCRNISILVGILLTMVFLMALRGSHSSRSSQPHQQQQQPQKQEHQQPQESQQQQQSESQSGQTGNSCPSSSSQVTIKPWLPKEDQKMPTFPERLCRSFGQDGAVTPFVVLLFCCRSCTNQYVLRTLETVHRILHCVCACTQVWLPSVRRGRVLWSKGTMARK